MRIVSWNISGGHMFKGTTEDAVSYDRENLDYFIERLEDVDPDVISLQESHTPSGYNGASQAEIIAQHLGYEFVNHPYSDRSHIKQGQLLSLAIISRFPIERSYFHLLPNPKLTVTRPNGDVWISFPVGFLVAPLKYENRKINIANCHMVPYHHFKRDFMEFVDVREDASSLLLDIAKEPALVGGDFNYNDLRVLLPGVFRNGVYNEAFEGIETAPGRGQQDHILFSHHWKLENYEVHRATTDHYICVTDLLLK